MTLKGNRRSVLLLSLKRLSVLMLLLLTVLWCPMVGQAKIDQRQDEFDNFLNIWSTADIQLKTAQKDTKVILSLTLGEMGRQGEKEFADYSHLPMLSFTVNEDTETEYKQIHINSIEIKLDNDTLNIIEIPIQKKYDFVIWRITSRELKNSFKATNEVTIRLTTVNEQYIVKVPPDILQEWKQVLNSVKKSPSKYSSWKEAYSRD